MPEPRLIPPPPDYPPTVVPASADRLPRWWEQKTPLPSPAEPELLPAAPTAIEQLADSPDEPEQTSTPVLGPSPYVVEIRTAAEQVVTEALPDPMRRRRVLYAAYNTAAAGTGWAAGLGPWFLDALHYYGATDTDRGVWVGAGVIAVTLTAEARTHRWRHPGRHALWRLLGWAARIPLASAVLALALYDPAPTR